MTSPAYDMDDERFDRTPITPRRTAINPVRSWDAVRNAAQLLVDSGAEPREIDEGRIAWNCFVRAAQTEKALPRPRPNEYGTSMPEVYRTPVEEFINRIERLKDKMQEYERDSRGAYPSAAQIQEYEEVTLWLRFVHGRDNERDMKIVWLRAKRAHPETIGRMFGLAPKTVVNIRDRQLENVGKRLKLEMGKVGCHLHELFS